MIVMFLSFKKAWNNRQPKSKLQEMIMRKKKLLQLKGI
jgi:hypothetical protein